MDEPNVRLLAALRAKGLALKTMLASGGEKAEKDKDYRWPPSPMGEVYNQLTTETAKALPDFANILPKEVVGSDEDSGASWFTLLVLTDQVVAVLNSVIPEGR